MKQYLELVQNLLGHGCRKQDRTGTGTLSRFGHQLRFDLAAGFPLLTTKRLPIRGIVHELLWMLSGETSLHSLHRHGVHIWDPWADEDDELGPVYGAQWRHWNDNGTSVIDQIAWVADEIQRNPCSRRLLVSAWNVAELPRMALLPCHCAF